MFALSEETRGIYVKQICQAGATALRIRGREVTRESEATTCKEAEALVQHTYSSSLSHEDMLYKITKMVKKLDPFTHVCAFLNNRPLLTRIVDNPLMQRDRAILQSIISKGEDASILVQCMDEVMKVGAILSCHVVSCHSMM